MRASNLFRVTGNLGGAVEVKETTAGTVIAKLSIAETVTRLNSDTGRFEKVHTNWIPVTVFGPLARRAASSLKKGERVTVVGTLKTASYEKEGESRRSFEVIADTIEKTQPLAKADVCDPTISDSSPSFDEFKGEVIEADPMKVK